MVDQPEEPISDRYIVTMNQLAAALDTALNGANFVLLVFEEPNRVNYISNCGHKTTINALREVADRLERNIQ